MSEPVVAQSPNTRRARRRTEPAKAEQGDSREPIQRKKSKKQAPEEQSRAQGQEGQVAQEQERSGQKEASEQVQIQEPI